MEYLGEGQYQLVVAPARTVDLAEGDVFQIDPDSLRPIVLQRSGNLTLWVYGEPGLDMSPLAAQMGAIGGRFDGVARGAIAIFTVPVIATFAAVEAILEAFVAGHSERSWMYGNVHGDDGVTPLGWWESM